MGEMGWVKLLFHMLLESFNASKQVKIQVRQRESPKGKTQPHLISKQVQKGIKDLQKGSCREIELAWISFLTCQIASDKLGLAESTCKACDQISLHIKLHESLSMCKCKFYLFQHIFRFYIAQKINKTQALNSLMLQKVNKLSLILVDTTL